MTVTVKFDDNDHEYMVDILKFTEQLGITEEDVKRVVQELIRKS